MSVAIFSFKGMFRDCFRFNISSVFSSPTPPVLSGHQAQLAVTQGSIDSESSALRNSVDESAKSMDIFKEGLSAAKEELSAIKEELSTVKEELSTKEGLSQKRERLRDGFNVRERVRQIEARFGTS
jgi:hypothetical protein